jgi:dual specificity MAP kinase phosphatase
MSFAIRDDPDECTDEPIAKIIDFINSKLLQKKNVLVHCRKAISRAPFIIIYFLIKVKGFSFQDAFQLLKDKKQNIDPNFGFIVILQNLN